jgi:ribosomal subunit interface protein
MLVRCHSKKSKNDCPKNFEAFVKERLQKLDKLPFKITKADVVIYKEGGFHNVELILKGAKVVRAQAATGAFEESLDKCVEKSLRQIKKLRSTHRAEPRRERRKNRRSHQRNYAPVPAPDRKVA